MLLKSIKLAPGMRDTNAMDNVMVKESSSIKMVGTMRVNGDPTKCTDGENCITRVENLHIKATGLKMNFMVLAKSTTTIQSS